MADLEADRRAAGEAEFIVERLRPIFAELEAEITAAWRTGDTVEAREDAWRRLQALDAIQAELNARIARPAFNVQDRRAPGA